MLKTPRLVVAAPSSGAGKTTVAAALLASWRAAGRNVQPFKVGPDYIDPTHLARAAGRTPRNLDGWFLDRPELIEIFRRGTQTAQGAVIEGVMGLFDGRDALGREGSTAQVARWLNSPVLLVVDARAMAGSIAALVSGFRDHDPRLRLAGVVANRVGSARHAEILAEALAAVGVPFFGYLPNSPNLELPERHLGLVLAGERSLEPGAWEQAATTLNVAGLWRVAQSAPPLELLPHRLPSERSRMRSRIALAHDAAFNFYYPEALDLLEQLGAELVPFSPLADEGLPAGVGAVWIGGGYPELYARQLAEARKTRSDLRRFRGPVYAECGGLMYLSEALLTPAGRFPMAGMVPGVASMRERPTLGYRHVEALADGPVAKRSWRAKGHAFHYSTRPLVEPAAWRRVDGAEREGYLDGRLHASYVHLYFPAAPRMARRFVDAACGCEEV